jgi:hypothetical protein
LGAAHHDRDRDAVQIAKLHRRDSSSVTNPPPATRPAGSCAR